MIKIHNFVQSLANGVTGEEILDKHFSDFVISDVDMELQRLGIDRIFYHPITEMVWKVEYKTDAQTQKTGNIFIETMSVDTVKKLGWIYTTQADVVMYLALPSTLYMFRPEKIEELMPLWSMKYRTVPVYNEGPFGKYTAYGVLIPQDEFAQFCTTRILE